MGNHNENFTGKTVLITGASRGIGAATALDFAAAGANLVLAARSLDAVQALANQIGDRARAVACDVARFSDVERAVALGLDTFGSIDIVIGNAGAVEPISHLADSNPDAWGHVIDVNLKGIYYGARAAIPPMLAAGGGVILNISSGAAHNPIEAWSHYCASKAGAAMVTRMIEMEYGDKGIRAMGLSPGTVATEMQREIKASGINAISQLDWSDHIPPEWVAKCILWMCGPAGADFGGQELSLRDDGLRRTLGLIP